jgi:hypothetical protein
MSDQIKFEVDTPNLESGYYVTSYLSSENNDRVYLHGPFSRPDQAADALRYDLIDTGTTIINTVTLSEKERANLDKVNYELINIPAQTDAKPFVWVGFWRDAMFAIELVGPEGENN